MKKLLIAAVLVTTVQGSWANTNANANWYGVLTTEIVHADKGKACKIHDVLGLVTSRMEASIGSRDWSRIEPALGSAVNDTVKKAKAMGANVVLGFRYVYQDATFGSDNVANPIGFSLFGYGTAAVVKCN